MTFKLTITCPVEVVATATITVQGDNMDEVYGDLERTLNKIGKKNVKWSVNQDDVEDQVNHKLVDIEDSEEVQT